jgi:hypothetical protein
VDSPIIKREKRTILLPRESSDCRIADLEGSGGLGWALFE